jgi:Required for nuclear transport of RNA pol II C-terminus 1
MTDSAPPVGSSEALRKLLSAFSEPPIYVRDQLLKWQRACLEDVSAVTSLVAAHSKTTEPALGMRQSALLGGALTLLSSSTIMGLLDVSKEPGKRLLLHSPKLPKGVEADSTSINHAAAACGNDAFREKLPIMLDSCESISALLACKHVDPMTQRRFLPEVLLGLLQCQVWCNSAAGKDVVNAEIVASYRRRIGNTLGSLLGTSLPAPPTSAPDTAIPPTASLASGSTVPLRNVAAALLSITCGEATMAYKLSTAGTTFAAPAKAPSAAAASASAGSSLDSAPSAPRHLMLAASALLIRIIVERSGVESFCDAVADACDMSSPMASDRARMTVASLLSKPPLEVVGSAGEYLSAVVPQLLRLLRLRARAGSGVEARAGIDWLHSVAAMSLTQMLSSRSFLILNNNDNKSETVADPGSGGGSRLSELIQSRPDLTPVPVPKALRPLHLVLHHIVVPLVRPLIAFAVPPVGKSRHHHQEEDEDWAGVAAYLRYCCSLDRDQDRSDGDDTGVSDDAAAVVIANEDEVMGCVEILHAVLTRGTPLPRAVVTRVFAPLALPGLFTLFYLARSNKLRRGGFGVACLEVICKILAQCPSKGALVALLFRSAAAAVVTTTTAQEREEGIGNELASDLLSSSFSIRDWYYKDIKPVFGASSSNNVAATTTPTTTTTTVSDPDDDAFRSVFNSPLPLLRRQQQLYYSFELGESAGYRLVEKKISKAPDSEPKASSSTSIDASQKRRHHALIERLASTLLEVVATASSSSSSSSVTTSSTATAAAASFSLSTLLVSFLLTRYGEAKTQSLRAAAAALVMTTGEQEGERAGDDDGEHHVKGSTFETLMLLKIMDSGGSGAEMEGGMGSLLSSSSPSSLLLGGIAGRPSSSLGLSAGSSSTMAAEDAASGRAIKSQFIGSLSLSLAAMALSGQNSNGDEDEKGNEGKEEGSEEAKEKTRTSSTTASTMGSNNSILALLSIRSVLHLTLSSLALPMPRDLAAVGIATTTAAAITASGSFTAAAIHQRACERFPSSFEPRSAAKKPQKETSKGVASLITVVGEEEDDDDGQGEKADSDDELTDAPLSRTSTVVRSRDDYATSAHLLSLLSSQEREDTEDLIVLCLSLLTAAAVDLMMASASATSSTSDVATSGSSSNSRAVWELLRSCLPLLAALSGYTTALKSRNRVSKMAKSNNNPLFLSVGVADNDDDENFDDEEDQDSATALFGLKSREIMEMAASLRALVLTLPAPSTPSVVMPAAASSPPKASTAFDSGAGKPTSTSTTADAIPTVDLGYGRSLPYDQAITEAIQLIAIGAGGGTGAGVATAKAGEPASAPSGSEPALQAAGLRILSRVFVAALKSGIGDERVYHSIFTGEAGSITDDTAGKRHHHSWSESTDLGAKGRMLLELLLQQLHHSDAAVNLAAIDALSSLTALRPAAMLPVLLELVSPDSYHQARDYLRRRTAASNTNKVGRDEAGRYLGDASLEEVMMGGSAARTKTKEEEGAATVSPSPTLPSRLRARVGEALSLAIRRLSGGSYLTSPTSDSLDFLGIPWSYLLCFVLLQVGARGWKITEALAVQLVEVTLEQQAEKDTRTKELKKKHGATKASTKSNKLKGSSLIQELSDEEDEAAEEDDVEAEVQAAEKDAEARATNRRHPYNLALSLVDASDLRASAVACFSELLVALSGNVKTLMGKDSSKDDAPSPALASFLFSPNPVSSALAAGARSATVCEDLLSALQGILTFEAKPLEGVSAIRKLVEKAAATAEAGEVVVDKEVRQVITACSARVRRSAASTLVRLLGLILQIPASAVRASPASESLLSVGGDVASASSVMQGLLRPGANASSISLQRRTGAVEGGDDGKGGGDVSVSITRRSNLAFVTNSDVSRAVKDSYALLQRVSSDDTDHEVRKHALGGLAVVDDAMRGSLGLRA